MAMVKALVVVTVADGDGSTSGELAAIMPRAV